MQRLVQKEKHVLRLQSELDHLKSSNPVEIRENVSFRRMILLTFLNSTKQDERAKREREKTKWTSVMDEIANLKTQVSFAMALESPLFII